MQKLPPEIKFQRVMVDKGKVSGRDTVAAEARPGMIMSHDSEMKFKFSRAPGGSLPVASRSQDNLLLLPPLMVRSTRYIPTTFSLALRYT